MSLFLGMLSTLKPILSGKHFFLGYLLPVLFFLTRIFLTFVGVYVSIFYNKLCHDEKNLVCLRKVLVGEFNLFTFIEITDVLGLFLDTLFSAPYLPLFLVLFWVLS